MTKVITVLQFEKSTPGTHFYSTKDTAASVRSIYIRKDSQLFADGSKPEHISVSIEAEK